MLRGRLYLAITAYILFVKQHVSKLFAYTIWLYNRSSKVFRLLKKAITALANNCKKSSVGKIQVPHHAYISLSTCKGYQVQILRI